MFVTPNYLWYAHLMMNTKHAPTPPGGTPEPQYEAVVTEIRTGETVSVQLLNREHALSFAAFVSSFDQCIARIVAVLPSGKRVRIGGAQ